MAFENFFRGDRDRHRDERRREERERGWGRSERRDEGRYGRSEDDDFARRYSGEWERGGHYEPSHDYPRAEGYTGQEYGRQDFGRSGSERSGERDREREEWSGRGSGWRGEERGWRDEDRYQGQSAGRYSGQYGGPDWGRERGEQERYSGRWGEFGGRGFGGRGERPEEFGSGTGDYERSQGGRAYGWGYTPTNYDEMIGGQAGQHRGRGPKGWRRSDERIREDICEGLSDDPNVDASNLEVTVKDCEVTLSGSVNTREEKRRAEDMVERISGVKDVHNNVRVQQQSQSGESKTGTTQSVRH